MDYMVRYKTQRHLDYLSLRPEDCRTLRKRIRAFAKIGNCLLCDKHMPNRIAILAYPLDKFGCASWHEVFANLSQLDRRAIFKCKMCICCKHRAARESWGFFFLSHVIGKVNLICYPPSLCWLLQLQSTPWGLFLFGQDSTVRKHQI